MAGLAEGLGYIYKGKPLMEGVGERIGQGIEQGTQNFLKGQELKKEKQRQKEIELHKQDQEAAKYRKSLGSDKILPTWNEKTFIPATENLMTHYDLLMKKGINPQTDKMFIDEANKVDLLKQQMEADTEAHLNQKKMYEKDFLARERVGAVDNIEQVPYEEFKKVYPQGYSDKNLNYEITHPYKSYDITKAINPTFHDMTAKAYGKDKNGKVFIDEEYIDKEVVPVAVQDILSGRSEMGNQAMQVIGRQADQMKVDMLKKANDPYLKYPFTPEEIDQYVDEWKKDMITKEVSSALKAEANQKFNEDSRLRQGSSTKEQPSTEVSTNTEQAGFNKTNLVKNIENTNKEFNIQVPRSVVQKGGKELMNATLTEYNNKIEALRKDNDNVGADKLEKAKEDYVLNLSMNSNGLINAEAFADINEKGKEEYHTIDGKIIKGDINDVVRYTDNKGKVSDAVILSTTKNNGEVQYHIAKLDNDVNRLALKNDIKVSRYDSVMKNLNEKSKQNVSSQPKKEESKQVNYEKTIKGKVKKPFSSYQVSKDGKKAKVKYADGTEEIIIL